MPKLVRGESSGDEIGEAKAREVEQAVGPAYSGEDAIERPDEGGLPQR